MCKTERQTCRTGKKGFGFSDQIIYTQVNIVQRIKITEGITG